VPWFSWSAIVRKLLLVYFVLTKLGQCCAATILSKTKLSSRFSFTFLTLAVCFFNFRVHHIHPLDPRLPLLNFSNIALVAALQMDDTFVVHNFFTLKFQDFVTWLILVTMLIRRTARA
jgi:hypothetical protein